jgi:hypothetical protein
MARLRDLGTEQRDQWMEVLERSFQYDFYHLPEYHILAEERGEGRAVLMVYEEGDDLIAIPFVLRPVETVAGLASPGKGWQDATSVYGYAGPIASRPQISQAMLLGFQGALAEALQEQRVVSVFSRLHPLIAQRPWLSGLGELISLGQTISIDLTLSKDAQRARYRRGHKSDLNRLRRRGATCFYDRDQEHMGEVVSIYLETMQRVDAAEEYFFDRSYFERLVSLLRSNVRLFACRLADEVICGAFFLLCNGIVQAHLGGTKTEYLREAPMKLLIDTARLWAAEQGAHVLHLGGGVGAKEDSLFRFKTGFSDRRHEFSIWRWVLLPEVYDQLSRARTRWNEQSDLVPVSPNYFPAYRCPAVREQDGMEETHMEREP